MHLVVLAQHQLRDSFVTAKTYYDDSICSVITAHDRREVKLCDMRAKTWLIFGVEFEIIFIFLQPTKQVVIAAISIFNTYIKLNLF